MENIIGIAKSYLEEKGIDTSEMTEEEIVAKYQELIAEEIPAELIEEVVEQPEEVKPVEEVVEEPEVIEPVDETPVEEVMDIQKFLDENREIIDSFNEEQLAVFNKLIDLIK